MVKLTRLLCFSLLLFFIVNMSGIAGIDSGVTAAPDNLENVRQEIGMQSSHLAGDLMLNMRLAPAAAFPIWTNDGETDFVDNPFWIAETQVTYELWYKVRKWAEDIRLHLRQLWL